jgi:outer membrane immunogenic protein
MDDTLLFLAGGVAWAQGNLDGIIGATPYNIDGTHWGWSIGGGFEHAMSDHVRIRLEYLYTRFASDNYFESVCGPGTCDADIQDFDDHEVKAGVLWAF